MLTFDYLSLITAVIPSLLVEGDTWIKFNVDEFTFGRINYDGSMWSNLSTQLISNYSVSSEEYMTCRYFKKL